MKSFSVLVLIALLYGCIGAPTPSWVISGDERRVIIGYDPYRPQPVEPLAQQYCAQFNKKAAFVGNPRNAGPFGEHSYEVQYMCVFPDSGSMGREKAGATQDDFLQQRYACMKEATTRYAGANVNPTGGSAVNQEVISCQMYQACMEANGFRLVPNGRFQMQTNCTGPSQR